MNIVCDTYINELMNDSVLYSQVLIIIQWVS